MKIYHINKMKKSKKSKGIMGCHHTPKCFDEEATMVCVDVKRQQRYFNSFQNG